MGCRSRGVSAGTVCSKSCKLILDMQIPLPIGCTFLNYIFKNCFNYRWGKNIRCIYDKGLIHLQNNKEMINTSIDKWAKGNHRRNTDVQ